MTLNPLPRPAEGSEHGAALHWYESFFNEAYWRYANVEYDPNRTARELRYLTEVLESFAFPGARVLDLGCGTGRHTIELAARGYDVIGIDQSPWAIEQAERLAEQQGVENRAHFTVKDMFSSTLFDSSFAAAVCVQSFGFGSDAQQRRLLRSIGEAIGSGVLVLDISNASWIMRHFVGHGEEEIDGTIFRFERCYDLTTARNVGSITITDDVTTTVLRHDIRLYQLHEILGLLRECGFMVHRVDADFEPGSSPHLDARYLQVVATPQRRATAVAQWSASESSTVLDLRWSPDEWEVLGMEAEDALVTLASSFSDKGSSAARRYPVTDPYGGQQACGPLSARFGVILKPESVTTGAGVTGLLSAVAGLADGGTSLIAGDTYPDLAHWAIARGGTVVPTSHGCEPSALLSLIEEVHPALIHLERPSISGNLLDLASVSTLCDVSASRHAIVSIDESAANYLNIDDSAVQLIDQHENLVVLRGVSKGYAAGGLRIGWAIATPAVGRRIRQHLAPLLTAAAAHDAALALIGAVWPADRLRPRIRTAKPMLLAGLERLGLDTHPAHPDCPWVLVRSEPASTIRILGEHGIAAKEHATTEQKIRLVRVAVPLSEVRIALLHECLPIPAG